jgi:exodeoxyribonuclease VII large subunit
MQNLNPVGRLRQGYSYTAGPDGRAVRSVKAVRSGDLLTIHVTDGRIFAEVRSTEETAE